MITLQRGLFVAGLALLVGAGWALGPAQVAAQVGAIGWGFALILLAYAPMQVFDTLGWRAAFCPGERLPGFGALMGIRLAGEALNILTPLGTLGGEPTKALLLRERGVPLATGAASVVVARTLMAIAQIAFTMLGLALLLRRVGVGSELLAVLGLAPLALIPLLSLFMAWQRRGLFATALRAARRLRLPSGWLARHATDLDRVDAALRAYYTAAGPAVWLSLAAFFAGWLGEALEVWVILRLMGRPVGALDAVALAASYAAISGIFFLVPGNLGTQEVGSAALFAAFGLSAQTGFAFSLIRRVMELAYVAGGLGCLRVQGGVPAAARK